MIKAVAATENGPLVIFGLSHSNLEKLKQGMPINVDMSELGGVGHVLIFAGQTEAIMTAELAEMIGPETKVKGMKQ